MKRLAFLSLLLGTLLLLTGIPVFAGTNVLSGTLTSANPLPNGRPDDDGNSCSTLLNDGAYYYTLRQIEVTVSGAYDYFDIGEDDKDPGTVDSIVSFYTGSPSGFDASNPLGDGCFTSFDDDGTLNLTAGVPYMLMISTYDEDVDNTGPYLFSLTGPGNVIDYTAAASNPMLADGRINGQQAAPVILYCNGTTTHGLTVDGQVAFNVENGQAASGAWGSITLMADGRMLLTSSTPEGKPYYFVYAGCPHGHYDAMSGDPAMVSDSGSY